MASGGGYPGRDEPGGSREDCDPASLHRTRLRAVFAKSAGVRQGQRHEILGLELTEAAAEAFTFAEFFAAIGAAVLGRENRRHGVPTMAREHARRAVVAGDDENVGLERVDPRHG